MPPAEQLFAENLVLKEELVTLRTQLAWLKRQLFGSGKSEKLDRAQLLLQLQGLQEAERAVTTQQVAYERQAGAPRPPRGEAFADLPVKETVTVLPAEVAADPDLYEKIGEEQTFEVDITPPQLYKRLIVRPKFRHRLDRNRPPVVASAPPRMAAGGYASPGLIAFILVSKYLHHLPLFRQEKMSVRWGAPLSRKTMADWVGLAGHYLAAITQRMKKELLARPYLQADETPIRCQDPDHPRGQCFQGYLWGLSEPGGDVYFEWRRSRAQTEANELLAGFKGILQVDGYEGYSSFCRDSPGVVRLGCWAHARRGFAEAMPSAPIRSNFILRLIGNLYQMERRWDEEKIPPAERARRRTCDFAPTLALLYKATQLCGRRALPQSALGKACTYLLHQWETLVRHCQYGQTRLDNNLMENAIRPSAIGKKNWLFIGHPDAGDRSAIIYSLIISCQRRGIDPLAYLRDVLARLPAMTTKEDLGALLPSRWIPPVTPTASNVT